MATTCDAIIIGTGQAGPFLARRLTTAGMKIAIIERKLFGGTCVNTGCIPTKTLVASAYAARMARRASEFGVDTGADARTPLSTSISGTTPVPLWGKRNRRRDLFSLNLRN